MSITLLELETRLWAAANAHLATIRPVAASREPLCRHDDADDRA